MPILVINKTNPYGWLYNIVYIYIITNISITWDGGKSTPENVSYQVSSHPNVSHSPRNGWISSWAVSVVTLGDEAWTCDHMIKPWIRGCLWIPMDTLWQQSFVPSSESFLRIPARCYQIFLNMDPAVVLLCWVYPRRNYHWCCWYTMICIFPAS
jgi:hypothetical protein